MKIIFFKITSIEVFQVQTQKKSLHRMRATLKHKRDVESAESAAGHEKREKQQVCAGTLRSGVWRVFIFTKGFTKSVFFIVTRVGFHLSTAKHKNASVMTARSLAVVGLGVRRPLEDEAGVVDGVGAV